MSLVFALDPADERLYLDEATEQVEAIEEGLLALEQGGDDPETVNRVFRAAHTLKGSAGMIGHTRLQALTHGMEDLFGEVREGNRALLGSASETLFAAIDQLRLLLDEVSAREPLATDVELLTARLRTLLSGPAAAASAERASEDAAPSPAPPAAGMAGETVLRCDVDPTSGWQGVRFLQLLLTADESGLLVRCEPSREVIESGEAPPPLRLVVAGDPDAVAALRGRLAALEDVLDIAVEHAATVTPAATPVGEPGAALRDTAPTPSPAARAANPAAGTARQEAPDARRPTTTVRIDVERLDELMDLVGELVVAKTRSGHQARELRERLGEDALAHGAEEAAQQLARIASDLQERVTRLRMLPVDTVFSRMPRLVRDTARALGREVDLVVEGRETELDRAVLDEVSDPLVHLVRNGIDHGIEAPEARVAAGKPRRGTLRLSAAHADGQVVITLADDGRGMDPAALREAAVRKGLMTADAAAALSDADALRVIFLPGFSTAATVTAVSGRGVGMDVVRTNIEKLGGRVEVSSVPGAGSTFSLSLPLTLAIIEALLVRAGGRVCALPLTGVVETLRISAADIRTVSGQPVLVLRDRIVPVVAVDAALGDGVAGLSPDARGHQPIAVVRSRGEEVALAVDALIGRQEIVLKSLGTVSSSGAPLAGATVLPDGSVALVADIAAIVEAVRGARRA